FIIALFLLFACAAAASPASPWSPKAGEYWIKVNKQQLRLTLFKGGEVVKSWPVSIGKGRGKVKSSRLDLITPTGTFTIYRVIPDATKLVFDPAWFDEPGKAAPGAYGSKLISFYNKWEIAIHGTNNPGSVGRWATHGCIRLKNPDIEDLVNYVKPKMKIVIVENNDIPFLKETI
ncbi:L,D-transpeptidase, partial [Cloacibacillus evryensis]|uniref:L,D-transpeptidase n=1 Tax=Cloacibacillus evryensis TaxID=508460 RepID=UPI003A8AE3B1